MTNLVAGAVTNTPWAENDELFFRELEGGRKWEVWMANLLRSKGFDVAPITPINYNRNIKTDTPQYTRDQVDLLVGDKFRLEMKTRKFAFTTNNDYPFTTAIVDTVHGWEQKAKKPHAILLISRPTKAVLVAPVSKRPTWKAVERFDSVRKIPVLNYEAPTEVLRPLKDLVDWMRADAR